MNTIQAESPQKSRRISTGTTLAVIYIAICAALFGIMAPLSYVPQGTGTGVLGGVTISPLFFVPLIGYPASAIINDLGFGELAVFGILINAFFLFLLGVFIDHVSRTAKNTDGRNKLRKLLFVIIAILAAMAIIFMTQIFGVRREGLSMLQYNMDHQSGL